MFASIPKDKDIFEINMEDAVEIIEAKIKSEAEKLIRAFPEDEKLEILKGRWGPYIAHNKNNYKLPKDSVVDTLTYAQVMEIVSSQAKPSSKKGAKVVAESKAKPKAKAKSKAKSKSKK